VDLFKCEGIKFFTNEGNVPQAKFFATSPTGNAEGIAGGVGERVPPQRKNKNSLYG